MRFLLSSLFCLSLSTSALAQQPGPGVLPGGRWNGGAITNPIRLPNGTCAAPSRTYASDTDLGSYRIGANNEGFCANTVAAFDYSDTRVNFSLPILMTGASKNITWNTDGGGNIGASGANRPDNGYFKTSVVVGQATMSNGVYGVTNRFRQSGNSADGTILWTNEAGTAGVGFNFASDSTLKLFARDGSSSARLIANDIQINNGGSFTSATFGSIRFSADGVFRFLKDDGATGGRVSLATGDIFAFQAVGGGDTATIKAKTHQATAGAFSTCNASPVEGMLCAITDSSTATWGATITGGGANHVIGYYNGTNWKVIG